LNQIIRDSFHILKNSSVADLPDKFKIFGKILLSYLIVSCAFIEIVLLQNECLPWNVFWCEGLEHGDIPLVRFETIIESDFYRDI